MKLGFTGTQNGMSHAQLDAVGRWVERWSCMFDEGHHGDCIGSDALFDQMMKRWRIDTYCHPPSDGSKRAWTKGHKFVYLPLPYLERNLEIVQAVEHLLATPKGMQEELRSGTWSTVRAARRLHVPITIAWPDGHLTREKR